jgi:hypothetical protein
MTTGKPPRDIGRECGQMFHVCHKQNISPGLATSFFQLNSTLNSVVDSHPDENFHRQRMALFQTSIGLISVTLPKVIALYRELVVYLPVFSSAQCTISTPSDNWTSLSIS